MRSSHHALTVCITVPLLAGASERGPSAQHRHEEIPAEAPRQHGSSRSDTGTWSRAHQATVARVAAKAVNLGWDRGRDMQCQNGVDGQSKEANVGWMDLVGGSVGMDRLSKEANLRWIGRVKLPWHVRFSSRCTFELGVTAVFAQGRLFCSLQTRCRPQGSGSPFIRVQGDDVHSVLRA